MTARGLYTRVIGDTILLAPPLSTSIEQIDQMVQIIGESIAAVSA
jgi:adenosylmethionine-8-amino-7-oxononanoate aminotransferase